MFRTEKVGIRVSAEEKAIMTKLAEYHRLPLGVYIRNRLLGEAAERLPKRRRPTKSNRAGHVLADPSAIA